MGMYECTCGFQAGTALAFQRHLERATKDGSSANHRLVLPAADASVRSNGPAPSEPSRANTRYGSPAETNKPNPTRTSGASFLHLDPSRTVNPNEQPPTGPMEAYVRQYVMREGAPGNQATGKAASNAHADRRYDSDVHLPTVNATSKAADPPAQQGATFTRQSAAAAQRSSRTQAAAASWPPQPPEQKPPSPEAQTPARQLKTRQASEPASGTLPPLPSETTSPTNTLSSGAARMMGNAMMSALQGGLNPFRLLGTGGGWPALDNLVSRRRSGAAQDEQSQQQQLEGEEEQTVHTVSTAHVALVSSVQDVLMWRSKATSAKVAGLGLYLILCCHHLPTGLDYLHPLTALCVTSLLYLMYNVAWRMTAGRKLPPSAHAARSMRLEAAIYQQVHTRLVAAASCVAHLLAALAVLLHRLLQGHRLGTTFWTVVSLWGLVLLGEARLLSHSALLTLAYVTAFALPWAYMQCRRAMDAFVAESVRWALSLLLGANRLGAGMALVAGVLILRWGALGLVLRASLAGAVALSILAWQNGYSEAEDSAAAALLKQSREGAKGEQRARVKVG